MNVPGMIRTKKGISIIGTQIDPEKYAIPIVLGNEGESYSHSKLKGGREKLPSQFKSIQLILQNRMQPYLILIT